MGWAEGLDPTIDPEADTLRKAGFDIGDEQTSSGPEDASQDEDHASDDDHSSDNGTSSPS